MLGIVPISGKLVISICASFVFHEFIMHISTWSNVTWSSFLTEGFSTVSLSYCQGLGMLVAHLLLIVEEECAFWLLQTILVDLVPMDFYGGNLLGAVTDQRVLR